MKPATRSGPLRYALIVAAIGASLFFAWLAFTTFLIVLEKPPEFAGPDRLNMGILVTAALVMAVAAGGLIARRAWGAYLLSVAAFLLSLPLAFLALWILAAWDVTNEPHPERILPVGAVGLAIGVGVAALRLGRSIRRENEGPAD